VYSKFMTPDSMASTSTTSHVVDFRYPETLVSVVVETWLPRHRFDVDEYCRMKEFGILKSDARVELIEGQVLDKTDRSADDPAMGRRESQAMSAVPDSWVPFHRFTVEEYYRMAEVGVLAPDARVELIEGEIIDMASMGSWHCGTVDCLAATFFRALSEHVNVRIQGAVRMSGFSEPQPDLALLKLRKDFYRDAHPEPPEIMLLVEVSDSSLRQDQLVKMPLFAHFGVPEFWIVDGVHELLHQYRSPRDGEYTAVSSTEKPGVVALAALPNVTVDLSDLFG
jgi:Uma2 family endonuclease